MNRKTLAICIALLTFTVGVAIAKLSLSNKDPELPKPGKQSVQLSNYILSGPFEHENLTVFLIHGADQPNTKPLIPLQEGMARKLVIVHETSDVNELAIENVSESEEVFVQSGDIVKGGQQDRVLAVDLILPARSGRLPISAFCIENFRWEQRGAEQADRFSSSEPMVATRSLKLATKSGASQSRVWDEVEIAQGKLSAGVNEDVSSGLSPSSLQLSLENQKVQESAAAYIDKLSAIVEGTPDAIGFILAINNKLNSADVYYSSAMFKRFWPKLLRTSAIEAVAERRLSEESEPASISAAGEFLVEAEQGEESFKEVTTRTHMIKRETSTAVFFETRDMDHSGVWIHRSYLMK